MAPPYRDRWARPLALIFFVLASLNQVAALNLGLCSTINTGSTPTNSSLFQSDGLCYTFCNPTYAFAIVQGFDCWCSDLAPGTTTTLSDCYTPCPGYPDDMCASASSGLFGYIALSKAPSGTQGASSSKAAVPTTSATPIQSPPTTANPTTTPPPSTPSSLSSSSTWTPTPSLSLETITGQVKTVTVTPTAPPADPQVIDKNGSSRLSGGAVAGATIAGFLGLALVGGFVYFCRRRQKRKQAAGSLLHISEYNRPPTGSGSLPTQGPSRTMSENSRWILATDGEKLVDGFVDDGPSSGNRQSRMLPVDQRLNPFNGLYQQGNKSRDSVNTINDAADYSRKLANGGRPILRATNPDE